MDSRRRMDLSGVAWTLAANTDWALPTVDWTLVIVVVAWNVECVHWSVCSAAPRTGRTDYVVSVAAADTQPVVVAVVVVHTVAAVVECTQPAVYSVAFVVVVASDRVVVVDCLDLLSPPHHTRLPLRPS